MGRGGARRGAGRKPGAATKLNQAARERVLADGTSPLDFMLSIMRNEDLPREDRFEAAKAAAPYVHARLAAVEHSGEVEHKYVARLPAPVENIDEWQQKHSSLQ